MNTTDAVTIAVVLGSLAAVTVEIALKDPGAFRDIAQDSEGFARRPVVASQASRMRRAVTVAGATAAAALAFFLA
jgi:hypothetical protein